MEKIIDEKVPKKDKISMQLAHYFITCENYTPMIVKGVKNEIWLENIDSPYRIIRINSNYIHNTEQFDFDLFRIKNIVKQVKKRTLSFKLKTLNIVIDAGANANISSKDNIDSININSEEGIYNCSKLLELYPNIKDNLIDSENGLDFILNITNDINVETEKKNKEYAKVFEKKDGLATRLIIFVNILLFVFVTLNSLYGDNQLLLKLVLFRGFVLDGEFYRLITSAFTHQNILHIIMNMYALYIIGTQVESYIGKKKYLIIYFGSILSASILSIVSGVHLSIGASGAIFGLMGTLLYFGMHYRLYLDSVLRSQIVPLIMINLLIGFVVPNIDNAAHIGGLIGGYLLAMATGANNKNSKLDRVNGCICYLIFTGVLLFILFM